MEFDVLGIGFRHNRTAQRQLKLRVDRVKLRDPPNSAAAIADAPQFAQEQHPRIIDSEQELTPASWKLGLTSI